MADWSDLSKKLDIGGIVSSVKNLVNPAGDIPPVQAGDQLGQALAQINILAKEVAAANAENNKRLQQLVGLIQQVHALTAKPATQAAQTTPAGDVHTQGHESHQPEAASDDGMATPVEPAPAAPTEAKPAATDQADKAG